MLFGVMAGLLVLLFTSSSGLAQSGACLVVADSLADAHDLYESHCTQPRQDCDPISGRWYCSSQNIPNSGVPAGAYDGQQSGSNPPETGSNSSGGSNSSSGSDNSTDNSGSAGTGSGVCVDPDGDGWGWNGASCRVGSSSGNNIDSSSGSSSANSGNQSGVICVDPDGDGWGWDGSASCRAAGAANNGNGTSNTESTSNNNSSGSSSCVDPDGDGWGWNGASSCRVTVAQRSNENSSDYRSSDITDLVLLTGQSNALGANTDYDAGLDSPDNQVFAFTSEGWRVADLNQVWDRGWHPRNDPNTDPSNNLLLHFGKRLVSRDRNRVVGFILVSEPGAAIANWDYNSEFYRALENRVLDAINQLPHKSRLDGVLWHQGETDANDTAYYTNKLNALISNFRSENWYSSGKPFICGEIAKRGGVNNRLNRLNSDNDSYTACVSAAGLSTRSDGSHFDAAGLRELGKRYADRYLSMTD